MPAAYEQGLVNVSQSASSDPQLIIRIGDVYLLTLALWAYDPHAEDLTEQQQIGVRQIAKLFEEAGRQHDVEARVVPTGSMIAAIHMGHTRPPPKIGQGPGDPHK